ncbi:MAG: protein translocase subunit SecD [Cyanobacteria bacterium J06641_5]
MQRQRSMIALIVVVVVLAIVTLVKLDIPLGLDLQGGSQLTIQVEPTEEVAEITADNLDDTRRVLENRVNGLGVAEAVVQTAGADRIVVQLPGVSDPDQAERVLGGTAELEFRAQSPNTEGRLAAEIGAREELRIELIQLAETPDTAPEQIAAKAKSLEATHAAIAEQFAPTELTGKSLQDAQPGPLPNSEQWQVAIRFDGEGGEKFAELTKNLAGTGRGLGIFLDGVLVSAPRVDVQYAARGIAGGSATVTGGFDFDSANDLAIQLRGGSLPFPVKVVENRTVGATLGRDSIRRSIIAGIAGLVVVLIFMAVYYRLPGLVADLALTIYTLLTLACYALVGVTLTLPGIAGFILSIGMAVDANVLIFERTREELRGGKTLYRAVESGFFRAFSSILDSNATTLIACAALFWLGSGFVRGFALTLGIGVAVSMFTALTCSRTLMLTTVLGFPKIRQRPDLFCPGLETVAKPAK